MGIFICPLIEWVDALGTLQLDFGTIQYHLDSVFWLVFANRLWKCKYNTRREKYHVWFRSFTFESCYYFIKLKKGCNSYRNGKVCNFCYQIEKGFLPFIMFTFRLIEANIRQRIIISDGSQIMVQKSMKIILAYLLRYLHEFKMKTNNISMI